MLSREFLEEQKFNVGIKDYLYFSGRNYKSFIFTVFLCLKTFSLAWRAMIVDTGEGLIRKRFY